MANDTDFTRRVARIHPRPWGAWAVGVLVLLLAGCAGQPEVAAKPAREQEPPQPTQAPAATDVEEGPDQEAPVPSGEGLTGGGEMALEIVSEAFESEGSIPVRYTCDGEDLSPPLAWTDPPEGTASFALIADDPDAPGGTWVHWLLFNIPGESRSLPEAVPADADLADGSRHGQNSWRRIGYGGPCPPGGTHRYFFKLYALDAVLELAANATKQELLNAMEGHILGQAELMGTFTRQ